MSDNNTAEKETRTVDVTKWYVSNGERTVGGYKSCDRAHRRKSRWNQETDTEWVVVHGDEISDDNDIPFPVNK